MSNIGSCVIIGNRQLISIVAELVQNAGSRGIRQTAIGRGLGSLCSKVRIHDPEALIHVIDLILSHGVKIRAMLHTGIGIGGGTSQGSEVGGTRIVNVHSCVQCTRSIGGNVVHRALVSAIKHLDFQHLTCRIETASVSRAGGCNTFAVDLDAGSIELQSKIHAAGYTAIDQQMRIGHNILLFALVKVVNRGLLECGCTPSDIHITSRGGGRREGGHAEAESHHQREKQCGNTLQIIAHVFSSILFCHSECSHFSGYPHSTKGNRPQVGNSYADF